jgi:hypothetical protein
MKTHPTHWCIVALLLCMAQPAFAQIFKSSLDVKPVNWKGKTFQISTQYPTTLPPTENFPWKKFDFKTQGDQYAKAVLNYVVEGNLENDWVVQNNKVRKWYHAPSMLWKPFGREFINGMTQERSSRPDELYPKQPQVNNWAVGFYNPQGGYTFGQVWADTIHPRIEKGVFPEGAVAAKLLFTEATSATVPYLQGTMEWQANVDIAGDNIKGKKIPSTVRLLQIDIAVKDSRAATTTGWVMGTFVYNANAKGTTIWERMVPAGLMWGNDPDKLNNSKPLEETWINPEYLRLFKFPNGKTMHLGYKGRLNGPVDNPRSSCLSCHATAQVPAYKAMLPDEKASDKDIAFFFRNVLTGQPFDAKPTSRAMDYSLQLSGGIENRPSPFSSNGRAILGDIAPIETGHSAFFLTSMEKEEVITRLKNDKKLPIKPKKNDLFDFSWLSAMAAILMVILVALRNKR